MLDASVDARHAMAKYLLLIVLGIVVWWAWRKSNAPPKSGAFPPSSPAAEQMVACARCGLNQPVSECVRSGVRYYCCEAHRRDAESESGSA